MPIRYVNGAIRTHRYLVSSEARLGRGDPLSVLDAVRSTGNRRDDARTVHLPDPIVRTHEQLPGRRERHPQIVAERCARGRDPVLRAAATPSNGRDTCGKLYGSDALARSQMQNAWRCVVRVVVTQRPSAETSRLWSPPQSRAQRLIDHIWRTRTIRHSELNAGRGQGGKAPVPVVLAGRDIDGVVHVSDLTAHRHETRHVAAVRVLPVPDERVGLVGREWWADGLTERTSRSGQSERDLLQPRRDGSPREPHPERPLKTSTGHALALI